MPAPSINIYAERVIRQAGPGKPADRLLREELRAAKGFSDSAKRAIVSTVFRYYRWKGWLDASDKLFGQFAQAEELETRFEQRPESFTDAEMIEKAVPSWTHEVMKVRPQWVRSLQRPPPLYLRIRPSQRTALEAEVPGLSEIPGTDTVRYEGPIDLFQTESFKSGAFEIQDLASQWVGKVCAPTAKETWWDACAGEGGKTLHLCELKGGKGLVWASDPAQWRLDVLKKRAARASVFNYRSVLWVNSPDHLPTKTKFDGILVDAPCSGLGTWARNPHARWTSSPRDVEELAALQKKIVATAARLLKPNGRLIYSVCTLTEAETIGVAQAITSSGVGLEPLSLRHPLAEGDKSVLSLWFRPEESQSNGMFLCGWNQKSSSGGADGKH